MPTKVRKQIYIDSEQEKTLKRMAASTGLSEAELIRQAIDRCGRVLDFAIRDPTAWEAELAFIDGLIAKGPLPGKRDWCREDLYDRAVLRRH